MHMHVHMHIHMHMYMHIHMHMYMHMWWAPGASATSGSGGRMVPVFMSTCKLLSVRRLRKASACTPDWHLMRARTTSVTQASGMTPSSKRPEYSSCALPTSLTGSL